MSSCTYNGSDYAPGSIVCMKGVEHRCKEDGSWEDLGVSCLQADGIVIRNAEQENPLPAD